jgi:hypothetical protein
MEPSSSKTNADCKGATPGPARVFSISNEPCLTTTEDTENLCVLCVSVVSSHVGQLTLDIEDPYFERFPAFG